MCRVWKQLYTIRVVLSLLYQSWTKLGFEHFGRIWREASQVPKSSHMYTIIERFYFPPSTLVQFLLMSCFYRQLKLF